MFKSNSSVTTTHRGIWRVSVQRKWLARLLVLACSGGAVAAACSDTNEPMLNRDNPVGEDPEKDASVEPGLDADLVTDAAGRDPHVRPPGPFNDFPEEPQFDDSAGDVPRNAPDLFESGSEDEALCLIEPEPGAIMPKNWLRPRFRTLPSGDYNLFEYRLSVDNQKRDFFAYSRSDTWALEDGIWTKLRYNSYAGPVNVRVRALKESAGQVQGGIASVEAEFTIAPVDADGKIVYWTTTSNGRLMGFGAGNETVGDVLDTVDVQQRHVPNNGPYCIGCHDSTPDGEHVAFGVYLGNPERWAIAFASAQATSRGETPDYLSEPAKDILAGGVLEKSNLEMSMSHFGLLAFSEGYWETGNRLMLTQANENRFGTLLWVDLEATSTTEGEGWGRVARNGDERGAGSPAWSSDGSRLFYVSSNANVDGRLAAPQQTASGMDIWQVPFNDGTGGDATPVEGASDTASQEYYPALSPDDKLLAFNRNPLGQNTYDAPSAELYVVPSSGGESLRLTANDPPACSGWSSPDAYNSWPKWSPQRKDAVGKSYYWLMFSSRRDRDLGIDPKEPGFGRPQLYITAVVVDNETGDIKSFPALYLWNQPADNKNHTPAWDFFNIPDPPIK